MEEKKIHINKGDEYLEEEEYHKAIAEYESAVKLMTFIFSAENVMSI